MSQDIRTILHGAFSYVRGQEVNKSAAGLTLDHLLQEQITTLKAGEKRSILDGKGESKSFRPSRFDQLVELERDIDQAVAAIQAAGDDADKLKQLGIYEADQVSKTDDEPSSGVDEVS